MAQPILVRAATTIDNFFSRQGERLSVPAVGVRARQIGMPPLATWQHFGSTYIRDKGASARCSSLLLLLLLLLLLFARRGGLCFAFAIRANDPPGRALLLPFTGRERPGPFLMSKWPAGPF